MAVQFDSAEMARRGRIGGLQALASHDAREFTQAARSAFLRRFEAQVDPDGVLDLAERQRRAEYAKRAHFARLALASSRKRSAKKKKAATEHHIPVADPLKPAEVEVDGSDPHAAG